MKIHRLDEDTVAIEGLDSFSSELLHRIPESADPGGNPAAENRLFPGLTEGREPQADREWKEYVEPELRELFGDAIGVVQRDLEKFPNEAEPARETVHLPVQHLEAWIHALNQARLALTARHGFTEQELEHEIPIEGGDRAFALFQVHFYGLLQEFFLRQLE